MAEPTPLTAFQQTYHWRNKNCGPWAKEWIKTTLPTVKVEDGPLSAEITEVTSAEGDCDLGQRKGKLLTIYDIEVKAKWKGTSTSGEEVTGTLFIPEFSHEQLDGISDYVFEVSVDGSGSAAEEVRQFARKAFPPAITGVLSGFREQLLLAHGMETPGASGASTPAAFRENYSPAPPGEVRERKAPPPAAAPAPAASTSTATVTTKPVEKKEEKKETVKTATVEVSASLQASAEDMWTLLTDENRVPMWSRSAAKIKPEAGSEYELFGGNVSGKVVEADRPKKLVQTWQTRSPGWPAGHVGTMTITLNQGDDSTKVTFTLDGVPAGKEADIERALDAFYIRGLKQMGLVQTSSSRTFYKSVTQTQSAARRKKVRRKRGPAEPGVLARLATPQVLAGTAAVGLAAVFVGLVASTLRNQPS